MQFGRSRQTTTRHRSMGPLTRRVRNLMLVAAFMVGFGGVITAGVADAAPLNTHQIEMVAGQAAEAAEVAAPHTSGHEPVVERVVAGGVATLLFGTMISVVAVSWRSFRQSVETERKRKNEEA